MILWRVYSTRHFFRLHGGVQAIKDLLINEEIRAKKVRLIGDDGEQKGIVSTREALDLARDKNLDLVNVAPNANPPVCKIMDYGKFKYEAIKKEKEARKKQKTVNIEEIRLSPNIDTHDLEVKANRANKFLDNGDKVKVSVRFRGRELGHKNIGKEVLEDFTKLTEGHGVVDKRPAMEGRSMVMFLMAKSDN